MNVFPFLEDEQVELLTEYSNAIKKYFLILGLCCLLLFVCAALLLILENDANENPIAAGQTRLKRELNSPSDKKPTSFLLKFEDSQKCKALKQDIEIDKVIRTKRQISNIEDLTHHLDPVIHSDFSGGGSNYERKKRRAEMDYKYLKQQFTRCKKDAPDTRNCDSIQKKLLKLSKELKEKFSVMEDILKELNRPDSSEESSEYMHHSHKNKHKEHDFDIIPQIDAIDQHDDQKAPNKNLDGHTIVPQSNVKDTNNAEFTPIQNIPVKDLNGQTTSKSELDNNKDLKPSNLRPIQNVVTESSIHNKPSETPEHLDTTAIPSSAVNSFTDKAQTDDRLFDSTTNAAPINNALNDKAIPLKVATSDSTVSQSTEKNDVPENNKQNISNFIDDFRSNKPGSIYMPIPRIHEDLKNDTDTKMWNTADKTHTVESVWRNLNKKPGNNFRPNDDKPRDRKEDEESKIVGPLKNPSPIGMFFFLLLEFNLHPCFSICVY